MKIWGPSCRRFGIQIRIFGGSKRASKRESIIKAFWFRFWSDFRRPGNIKNKGFVWEGRIFLRFRALQDEMRFGSSFGGVLGRFLEAFWAILGGFGRFGRGVKNNKNSKPKLNATKKENSAKPAGLGRW